MCTSISSLTLTKQHHQPTNPHAIPPFLVLSPPLLVVGIHTLGQAHHTSAQVLSSPTTETKTTATEPDTGGNLLSSAGSWHTHLADVGQAHNTSAQAVDNRGPVQRRRSVQGHTVVAVSGKVHQGWTKCQWVVLQVHGCAWPTKSAEMHQMARCAACRCHVRAIHSYNSCTGQS